MRTRILLLAALWTLIAAPSVLGAQNVGLKIRVPFPFTIANITLDAGEYVMSPIGDRALRIQPMGGRAHSITVVTNPVTSNERPKLGNLIFTCYEDHCFLSQFWMNEQYFGHELPKSEAERRLAADTRDYQIAVVRF